jgi:hypothetical protein
VYIWKGLTRVKSEFFFKGFFEVGDGLTLRFWEDIWLGDTSLAHQYPFSYNIVQLKNVLVAQVLALVLLNIGFKRSLTSNKWNVLLNLCQRLMAV